MRFPWTKRTNAAKAETERAKNDYEWAVAQRTTVSDLVQRIVVHGEKNRIIESLQSVARGGHR